MKIQPRQQLLDVWRATARSSYQDFKWLWGGREYSNSVSDAEQLLCIMSPATSIGAFKLDQPDETAEDVLESLNVLGDAVEIPQLITRVITEYMERYTTGDGTPIFAGASGFASRLPDAEPTPEQQQMAVVESFASSMTLSLATIAFVRVFRTVVRREDLRRNLDRLEQMASSRLSAAMVGLLRSFAVRVFSVDSAEGNALIRTANQSRQPPRRVVEELRIALREVVAALRDTVVIGSGQVGDALDNPYRLMECGWSWGIVRHAPSIETMEPVGDQVDGVAVDSPYLYFTRVALDAIEDLFSERTRILGLLNEEQARLAQALQVRYDLTQTYWSRIATFGGGRWPLEDMPWRTTDEEESDYFTLLISMMVISSLRQRRGTDADLSRVGRVLAELANRGKITRRPFTSDSAIALHVPGVRLGLSGSESGGGPPLDWVTSDYSPLLLRATLRIAGLVNDTESRGELLDLADEVWEHLAARRMRGDRGQDLWDQPEQVFAEVRERYAEPSWSYTERVTECLITAAQVTNAPPLRSARLAAVAADLLSEAEHLFDQELLYGSAHAGPSMRSHLDALQAKLRRAREVVYDRPGTATVLATEVLRALDQLVAAREAVTGTL